MLGEALYFAGGLGCPLEYLHRGFRPGFETRWCVDGLLPLTHKVWRHRTDPNGTLSIKLFWSDIADIVEQMAPGQLPCLRTVPATEISEKVYRDINDLLLTLFPDPYHIHLERRDRLRQAVSWFTAIRTDNWRKIPMVENVAVTPIDYDFDMIGNLIGINLFCHDHWRAFFAANDVDAYEISYEALASRYTETTERLLRTLGRPVSAPVIRMERQSTARSEALMHRFLQDQRGAKRI